MLNRGLCSIKNGFFYSLLLMALLFSGCGSDESSRAEDRETSVSLEKIHEWNIKDTAQIPFPRFSGVLEDGSLVITDHSLSTINHFSEEGTLITVKGGQGRGPGEFMQMSYAVIHPDGRVAVADLNNTRITVTSVYSDDLQITDLRPGWPPQMSWVEDGIVILNSSFDPEKAGDVTMRLYKPEMDTKEEFMHLELEIGDPPFEQISCTFCRFRFLDDLSFFTTPQDTSYRIFRVNPETGEEVLFRRSGIPPVAFTEEEREAISEQRLETGRQTGMDLGDFEPPRYQNRFRDFFPDDKGRLWAVLISPVDEPMRIDLFSPEAEYMGSLDAPEKAVSLQYVPGGKLLVHYQNEDPETWKAGLYRIVE